MIAQDVVPKNEGIRVTHLKWAFWGVLAAVPVNIAGEIRLGELFALIWVATSFWRRKGLNSKVFGYYWLALFWSAGQFLSDIINQNSFESSLKGVFAPLVFISTIVAFFHLFEGDRKKIAGLFFGLASFDLVKMLVAPTEFQLFEPWKWGFGPIVLLMGSVSLSFGGGAARKWSIYIFSLVFFVVCVKAGARSLGVFPVLGAILFSFSLSRKPTLQRFFGRRWISLKFYAAIILTLFVANSFLSYVFSQPWIKEITSPEIAEKYEAQANSEVGLLLAGRSESLVTFDAFLASPFVGHGSWALDKDGYRDRYAQLKFMYGITEAEDPGDSIYIPTHSYLLGSMVWSGIFGGLFWVIFSGRMVKLYVLSNAGLPYFFHVYLLGFIWNLFFSPFGAYARWWEGVFIASFMSYSLIRKR